MQDYALFEEAVSRRDYAALQESIRHLSKKDALDHLENLFPHKARKWFERNLGFIMALDPEHLGELLDYNDPTPRKAIRNVEREGAIA